MRTNPPSGNVPDEPIDPDSNNRSNSSSPAGPQRRPTFGGPEGLPPSARSSGKFELTQIGGARPIPKSPPTVGGPSSMQKAQAAGGSLARVNIISHLEHLASKYDVKALRRDGLPLTGTTAEIADTLLASEIGRVAIVADFAKVVEGQTRVLAIAGAVSGFGSDLNRWGRHVTFVAPPETLSTIVHMRTIDQGIEGAMELRYIELKGARTADGSSPESEILSNDRKYGPPPDLVITVDDKPR